jgi:anaphase-promoting complex subunit 8
MLDCFGDVQVDLAAPPTDPKLVDETQDLEKYTLAKSYFDLKEYLRAARTLERCEGHKAVFLRSYSLFLV